MSKRNQKRIENELKDLLNDKANSNKCGECGAGFPTWASINLGIFLCGRCASLHRKLGEDVSIVKSLSLDKWKEEDLNNLTRIGNKKAKQIWNPKKVPFPFDDDDKDEIYQYLRQKYISGKYRYDPIDEEDYDLRPQSNPRSNRSRSSTTSRPNTSSTFSRSIPNLAHRDISEYDRLKYRKLEKRLEEQGFTNTDKNYESLYLAKGDINLAIDILTNPASSESDQPKPALPRRPGTSISSGNGSAQSISHPFSSSSDWWNGQQQPQQTGAATSAIFDATGVSQQVTGLIQPPQQYLDPATGIIYVDPLQQEQYLQQQQQLQLQQQSGFYQQPQQTSGSQLQQPFHVGAAQYQQPFQTGLQQGQYQQSLQTGGVMPQRTGVDKNQLLSLYNTANQQQPQQQQQFEQPQQQQQFQQPQQGYQYGNGFSSY